MDGGTCESTAFVAYGYRATGMCVALGNYHNMDEKRRRIAPETIHLSDWKWMVDWFEALVMDRKGFGSETDDLRRRLDDRYRQYEKLLRS
jgi:endoglucanase